MPNELLDISRTISPEAVVYPGDDPLVLKELCHITAECPCNITQLGWTTHFLTHVDPPLHFIERGASLDEVPLSRFVGDAIVVPVSDDIIQPEHFQDLDGDIRGLNILFKTRHSQPGSTDSPFDQGHVYVSGAAAKYAAKAGVNLVGHDYISVDRFGDDQYPAHRALLGNNVLILEGIDLTKISPGRYTLVALPLKIARGDGSPVRAVLMPK